MLNIILVNYSSAKDTINCIESVFECNHFFECKIQVFDNFSVETDREILKEYEKIISGKLNEYVKAVEFEFCNDNTGFAHGNNFFIEKADDGDILWILNNDTLVNEELLKNIAENLPAKDEVVYMDCHTFENEFHDGGMHYVNLLTGKNSFTKKNKNYFGYICGASFLLIKSEKTPLIDEAYFLYYEDCDYGKKLEAAGYKYRKLENCYFMHKIGGSSVNAKKKVNLITLRSQVLFMRKYGKCFGFYVFAKWIFLVLFKRNIEAAKKFAKWSKEIKADSLLPNHL